MRYLMATLCFLIRNQLYFKFSTHVRRAGLGLVSSNVHNLGTVTQLGQRPEAESLATSFFVRHYLARRRKLNVRIQASTSKADDIICSLCRKCFVLNCTASLLGFRVS